MRKGETLYGIARIYNVSADELKEANPEWVDGLKTGQYIKIPMKDPVQPTDESNKVVVKEGNVHQILAGETLYSISRKYKVGIPELKTANPGLTNNLNPGQTLIIPELVTEGAPQEDEKKFYEHTVKAKETLYGIARKYRISIDSLGMFNPGLTENIYPGEVIRIP